MKYIFMFVVFFMVSLSSLSYAQKNISIAIIDLDIPLVYQVTKEVKVDFVQRRSISKRYYRHRLDINKRRNAQIYSVIQLGYNF